MNSISIIVSPTYSCNLKCDYCYNAHCKSQRIIDLDLVEQLIDKSFQEYDFVSFVWKGGEPLLIKRVFYKKVCKLQKKYSKKHLTSYRNSIQTNGTLLDKKWIRFLKSHKFILGISFDGIHNEVHRGQTSNVIKAIKLCTKLDLPFGCISVITKDNIDLLQQYIYIKSFVKEIKLTPCFKTDTSDHTIECAEYINELRKLFDYWLADKDQTIVQPFDNYIKSVLGIYTERECSNASCLGRIIEIDPEGIVRICSHIQDDAFNLGYFYNYNSISEIFKNENFLSIVKNMIKNRNLCINRCEYFDFCQGGCCSERYMQNDGSTLFSCNVIKEMYPYIQEKIYKIIANKEDLSQYNPSLTDYIQEAIAKNPFAFDKIQRINE